MSRELLIALVASVAGLVIALILQGRQRPGGGAVKRGQLSWEYFYLTFGFALTIEAGVVALIEPLHWPTNLMTYGLASVATIYLWSNGWFQNKLIGLKARYEARETDTDAKPYFGCSLLLLALFWLLALSLRS